jgi:hypothetical protein
MIHASYSHLPPEAHRISRTSMPMRLLLDPFLHSTLTELPRQPIVLLIWTKSRLQFRTFHVEPEHIFHAASGGIESRMLTIHARSR